MSQSNPPHEFVLSGFWDSAQQSSWVCLKCGMRLKRLPPENSDGWENCQPDGKLHDKDANYE